MRDITADLLERLDSIKRQRSEVQRKLVALQEYEERLLGLLRDEEARAAELSGVSFTPLFEEPEATEDSGPYSSPLARFVLDTLEHNESCNLASLKFKASKEGVPFGRKNPGRSLHFLLTGMAQKGLVKRDEHGNWRLESKRPQEEGQNNSGER